MLVNGQIPLDYGAICMIMSLVGMAEGIRLQELILQKTGKQQYTVLLMGFFVLLIFGSSLSIHLKNILERYSKGLPLLYLQSYCARD